MLVALYANRSSMIDINSVTNQTLDNAKGNLKRTIL